MAAVQEAPIVWHTEAKDSSILPYVLEVSDLDLRTRLVKAFSVLDAMKRPDGVFRRDVNEVVFNAFGFVEEEKDTEEVKEMKRAERRSALARVNNLVNKSGLSGERYDKKTKVYSDSKVLGIVSVLHLFEEWKWFSKTITIDSAKKVVINAVGSLDNPIATALNEGLNPKLFSLDDFSISQLSPSERAAFERIRFLKSVNLTYLRNVSEGMRIHKRRSGIRNWSSQTYMSETVINEQVQEIPDLIDSEAVDLWNLKHALLAQKEPNSKRLHTERIKTKSDVTNGEMLERFEFMNAFIGNRGFTSLFQFVTFIRKWEYVNRVHRNDIAPHKGAYPGVENNPESLY